MKLNGHHIFVCDEEKYIFFSEQLQLYKLDNPYIKEYVKISESKKKSIDSYLTDTQLKQVGTFIRNQLENNPKPDFALTSERINSLILNVSGTKCNLNCTYCFAFADKNYSLPLMNLTTAKKAIDFLVSINPNEEYYGIVFFGGEPFINYKLIVEIANYCEEIIIKNLGKKFTLSATTNGTILNKQLLNVFQKYGSVIFVSLDGPEYKHNKNRPYHNRKGSFNKVISNIELLKKYNVKHSFRPTITSDCENLVEIVDFFEKLETEFSFEFTVKPNFKFSESAVFNDEKVQSIGVQYFNLIEYYFEKVKRNEKIFCNNIVSALRRIHFRQAKKYTCSAGRAILTVNSDNTLYSCQNLSNLLDANIGTLDTGINKSKLEKIISPYVNTLESCKDCWVKYLCSGSCFAEKYTEYKTINIPLKHKCELKRMRWDKHLVLYQKIKNFKPDYFENIRQINAI
ncbi:MAG: radical SAM protein [Bacteroidales bacterium]